MNSPEVTIEEIQESLHKFGIWDYVMFVAMLVGCSGIGLYFACQGQKKKKDENAADEYLLGGRNMSVFPISMSLVASFISGITLLGNPTETYIYGTQFVFIIISLVIPAAFVGYAILPVFHEMHLSSTYEYLERRYDKKVRLFGSVLFSISMICWLPIVIYVPALAFNQVTGINVHVVTPCVCIVCIFYTAIGGLKAVVWTDVVQSLIMYCGMLTVTIKGTLDVGGVGVVWQRNWDSGRLEVPDLGFDFTSRHSLLALIIGGTVYFMQATTLNQNMIQRYLTLPSMKKARRALWIYTVGIICFIFVCCYSGLVVYATYYDCDPLTTKLAKAKDQLLPLLVMRVLGDYPGLPGIFVAGIFSAALSSLSTGLNSMSAVVLEDFAKPLMPKMNSMMTNLIMKGVVVIFGALCVALVFVVEKLGTVLQLTMSLCAMTYGPTLGVFVSGMLVPWINRHGAFYGGLSGLTAGAIVILGAQDALSLGEIKYPTKPTSVEGCDYIFNATLIPVPTSIPDEPNYVFPLFRLGYLWYTIFGTLVTLTVALVISYFTGMTDLSRLDPMSVSPLIRKYLPRSSVGNEARGTSVADIVS